MGKDFTPEWVDWVELNIRRGCDRDGIFRILLDEGFGHEQIVAQMGYRPSVDTARIKNPLRELAESSDRAASGFARKVRLFRDRIYLPNASRPDTGLAEIYLLDDFLDAEECRELVARIKSRLRASEIAAASEKDPHFRTSSTCDLGNLNDPFVREIDNRICRMLGVDASYSEAIQGQHYAVGQEFKPHTDYFEADQFDAYCGSQGQRTYTFFIYLNEVEEGGETEFPRLGLKIRPRPGRAVIWNNLTEEGVPNTNTIHHAVPVVRGEKCVITKWFRANGSGPMYTKEPHEFIPIYTRTGFGKSRLDPDLFRAVAGFYRQHRDSACDEAVEGGYVYTDQPGGAASTLVQLPPDMRAQIHESLLDELTRWSGVALVPTHVYGIRTYRRGAVLQPHRDRLQTHIISAIINVDQQADTPWALAIDDNYYRTHRVYLEPGEVIFYEGGRLAHGRPEPFEGEYYANIFCHYRPA